MRRKRHVLVFAGRSGGFALALAALLLLAWGGFLMAAPSDAVEITAADAGKTVMLVVGERLIVKLDAQPGTGFGWEADATSTSLLSFSSTNLGAAGMPGAVETQSLTFLARSAGEGDLKLVYRRAWEKDAVPAKSFSVSVKVTAR
jgi:inhibitor of cysteine peptidase